MKRLHVHVSVDDLERSIGFYATLFAAEPTVRKPDYAKWMLEDPRVNFAVSTRGSGGGLDHLGIQVESEAELAELYGRLHKAGAPVLEQGAATCCYANSEKRWISDPQGLAWEAFFTTGESTVYGDGMHPEQRSGAASACCAPAETVIAPNAREEVEATAACCAPPRATANERQNKVACCGPRA